MRLISNEELTCVAGGAVLGPQPPNLPGQDGNWTIVDGSAGAEWMWVQRVTITATESQQSAAWNGIPNNADFCKTDVALGVAIGAGVAGFLSKSSWVAAIGGAIGGLIVYKYDDDCQPAKPSHLP